MGSEKQLTKVGPANDSGVASFDGLAPMVFAVGAEARSLDVAFFSTGTVFVQRSVEIQRCTKWCEVRARDKSGTEEVVLQMKFRTRAHAAN